MSHLWMRAIGAALSLLLLATPAYALPSADGQGGVTSSISGTVVDTAGGVIPGASVVVTSNATGS